MECFSDRTSIEDTLCRTDVREHKPGSVPGLWADTKVLTLARASCRPKGKRGEGRRGWTSFQRKGKPLEHRDEKGRSRARTRTG